MKPRLAALILVVGWLHAWLPAAHAHEITPAVVYAQAVQVEKEVALLRHHYKVTAQNPVDPVATELQPRHVWQKTYVILTKLSIFRRKHGFPGFVPLAQEPQRKTGPAENWGQVQRILTEIRIIKAYLGITAEVTPATPVGNKRPVDVFNKLNQIAYTLDTLNDEPIAPSAVYAEALRINADVDALLRKRHVADVAIPPARYKPARPRESLAAALALMDEIQRVQRQLGLSTTDFGAFAKRDDAPVVPADVFNLTTLCLAELQEIKVQMGMPHRITPPPEFQEGKSPVDVTQLLGYVRKKLQLLVVR